MAISRDDGSRQALKRIELKECVGFFLLFALSSSWVILFIGRKLDRLIVGRKLARLIVRIQLIPKVSSYPLKTYLLKTGDIVH
jgi:hypothetical protein